MTNNAHLKPLDTLQKPSIIIPFYSEEEVLPILKKRLDELVASLSCGVEIVCLDDGSRDCTATLEERESFQTLLLPDVLEYLPEPVEFLLNIRNIRSSFPKNSHLILTVPARQELWSNYDEHYRHFRCYDLDTVRQIVKRVGGTICDLRYFSMDFIFQSKFWSVCENRDLSKLWLRAVQ